MGGVSYGVDSTPPNRGVRLRCVSYGIHLIVLAGLVNLGRLVILVCLSILGFQEGLVGLA